MSCELPDKVMDDDIWNPEVLDDVRSDIDLASRPVSGVIQNHPGGSRYDKVLSERMKWLSPVFWPPHVVSKSHTYFLKKRKYCVITIKLVHYFKYPSLLTENKF